MIKHYTFILFFIGILVVPSWAFNGKDLKWHTDCLVNSILTGEDLDASFVKQHLSIGCDQKDFEDNEDENPESISKIFFDNQVVQRFKEEDCIKKIEEFCNILNHLFKESHDVYEKTACIIVGKEVCRNTFGVLFNNLNKEDRDKLEVAKNCFLEGLKTKNLIKEQDLPLKNNINLSNNAVEKIYSELPFLKDIPKEQLNKIATYFTNLKTE
jgi:hypothetical protein